MMKISHIVPVDLLSFIEDRDFYMCLANIANKNSEYLEFYKRKSEEGKFVLMDNGAAEGEQLDPETMLKMINLIHPTEVILNDSLFESKETVVNSIESLNFYRGNGYDGRVMFVPQGRSISEWIDCLFSLNLDLIDTVGIPKHLVRTVNDPDARYKCCKLLENLNKDIHLLGCKDSIYEVEKIFKEFKNVRSCDTAIAYIYSKEEERIDNGIFRPHVGIDFLNSGFTRNQRQLLDINIGIFDNLIKSE